MEDIDFNFKTNDLSKNNPEDGVILKFNRFMVKKKWLEKGGVVPSNDVDSRSLCDKVLDVLKGVNDSESGLRNIQEILATAINNGGQDMTKANKIQHFLDSNHEPKVKLESLERALLFFNS